MPVVKIENIHEGVSWGLWKIDESIESLSESIPFSRNEPTEIDKISNIKRKKESLGARLLLKHMLDQWHIEYQGLTKDEHDKPHLYDIPIHISLAHAFPFAAAIINKNDPCGIDIEKPKESLFHIAEKFLNDLEKPFIDNDLEKLCITWAAKEVLYKIYGKKYLSFKENLIIDPFKKNKKGIIQARRIKGNAEKPYALSYQKHEDHIICYGY